jgi:hypothetical protein
MANRTTAHFYIAKPSLPRLRTPIAHAGLVIPPMYSGTTKSSPFAIGRSARKRIKSTQVTMQVYEGNGYTNVHG